LWCAHRLAFYSSKDVRPLPPSQYILYFFSNLGSLGFLLIGIAAALGTIRFSGIIPRVSIVHDYFSTIGAHVGIPLIGLQFGVYAFPEQYSQLVAGVPWPLFYATVVCAVSLFVTSNGMMLFRGKEIHGVVIILLSNLLIIAAVYRYYVTQSAILTEALLGVLLLIISGTLVKDWGGLRRVDWFHYGLALSLLAFYRAQIILAELSVRTLPLKK